MKILICDIDGVLADCEHRLHFIQNKPANWDGFFEACDQDKPITPMIQFLWMVDLLFIPIFITGRPERIRKKTRRWLDEFVSPLIAHHAREVSERFPERLLMRKDEDHRPDHIIKKELFENFVKNKDDVIAVFEDRDRVVEMWREMGLLCLQPKKGDY